jgi:general nucleoside transport system ATP-binding protein
MVNQVEFKSVCRHYGNVKANDQLNFDIKKGEIHGLIGENGAGKSTAMKLLFGMEQRTSGDIFVNGQLVQFKSSMDAQRRGLGMVHQHFMLSHVHTALENILLQERMTQSKSLSWFFSMPVASVESKVQSLAVSLGFKIPWHSLVSDLSVEVQQQIEIVKLLVADANVLILDEPTAVLSPQEIHKFLKILRELKNQGRTIILITHKLDEVKEVCDRVTIMRQGRTVITEAVEKLTVTEMASYMVGRQVNLGRRVLDSKDLQESKLTLEKVDLAKGSKVLLKDVSLQVRGGEIVGIAGIHGNGQQELMHLLYGPRTLEHYGHTLGGKIAALGCDWMALTCHDVKKKSCGIVYADRHHEGALLQQDLIENEILHHIPTYNPSETAEEPSSFLSRYLGILRPIDRKKALQKVQRSLGEFDVRPPIPERSFGSFSGGNQQKFVMASALLEKPELILCSEPTRGVDVGSIEQIHGAITDARARGAAILLVSSQLEELLSLCDRILVFFEGRINAEFSRNNFNETAIGLAMCADQMKTSPRSSTALEEKT